MSLQTDSDESQHSYPLHKVQHYKQTSNWDCGVSCVLMLLSAEQREHFLNNFQTIVQEEGFGHSTWTIDLCYLLKRFGIKHCMYTTMLGVNKDYEKDDFYKNSHSISQHASRVERRFAEAPSAGLQVAEGRLSLARVLRHVRGRGPALLLVDAGRLACDRCRHNHLRAAFRRWFGGGYRGHYVLVVGEAGGRVVFRDPALRPRLCAAAPAALLAARAARGTDHDTVLVYKHYT